MDKVPSQRAVDREEGFTILETVIALALVALVVVGLATTGAAGLRLTGRSNGRQIAVQAAVRSIELFRTYEFDALTLATPTAGPNGGYDGPGTPDEGVQGSSPNRTYLIPLAGGGTEAIVESSTGSVLHKELLTVGQRTVTVYRYVTWTTSSKVEKRLTVVAIAPGTDTSGGPNQSVMSSVFSKGRVDFPSTTLALQIDGHPTGKPNIPLTVDSSIGFPSSPPFTVRVDNEYFTVTSVSGNNWLATGHGTEFHSPGAVVVIAATLGPSSGGAPAPPQPAPDPRNLCSDSIEPVVATGSPVILKGTAAEAVVGFTSSRSVILISDVSDACEPLQMRFGETKIVPTDNSAPIWQVYSPSSNFLLADLGDGDRKVYAQYRDDNGNSTKQEIVSSVTLDTKPPVPAPVMAQPVRSGGGATVTLTWTNVTTDTYFNGYRVFQKTGGAGAFIMLSSVTKDIKCTSQTCQVSIKPIDKDTGYTYFVAGIDKAGNISEGNNALSV